MSGTKPDTNFKSYVNETDLTIDAWNNPDIPSDYDDVMKFSNCQNVHVNGVVVKGGNEDCIDAVRGKNYKFENLTLEPLNNGITIKGSVSGWHLKNILFTRKGKEYTIEIGQYDNYWTPSTPPTRDGIIESVKMIDEGRVTVRLWDAEKPQIFDCPNVRVIKIPKFIWFPYFVFRSIQRNGLSFFKKTS
jgi:hypothetical protein